MKYCLNCGTGFQIDTRWPHKKFCCKACKYHYKHTSRKINYEYICTNCGKIYNPKEKNRNRFCSRECDFEYRTRTANGPTEPSVESLFNHFISIYTKRLSVCINCGKLFISGISSKFCSAKCSSYYYNLRKHIEKIVKCRECGVNFIDRYGDKRRNYCSFGCLKKFNKRKRGVRKRIGKEKATIDSFSLYQVLVRDEYRCGICGEIIDISLPYYHKMAATIDHIIPLSKGGTHCWNNIQSAHLSCNSAKWNNVDYKHRGAI